MHQAVASSRQQLLSSVQVIISATARIGAIPCREPSAATTKRDVRERGWHIAACVGTGRLSIVDREAMIPEFVIGCWQSERRDA